jgi:glycosyltransferase involved in cell wall biosynthesis
MGSLKKKVLHVLVRLDYGGIETWLLSILRSYNRHDFQMDVCLVGRRGQRGVLAGQAEFAGSSIFVIPMSNPIKFLQSFQNLAGRYDAVVVHTGTHTTSFILLAAYLGGVKQRLTMLHNTHDVIPIRGLDTKQSGILLNLLAFLCNTVNRIIATDILGCSVAALDQNYPRWRADQSARVQYYGIDLDRFRTNSDCDLLRQSLGIPSDALVVGHIGRFSQQKNHHNFINVAKYLNAVNPDLHFLLVGDGPLKAEIEMMIHTAQLQNRFHLTGVRSDIPDLMKIMDVAYFPSLHEGFPMTFIEAQVRGLPVMTAARPEMREAICPENHQWCIVDTNDIECSGDAILFLLSHPDIRKDIAIRGQKWASERFSIQTSTQSLEDILLRNPEILQHI